MEHTEGQSDSKEPSFISIPEEDIVDPTCDPNNPKKVLFEDITAAVCKISDKIKRTPCVKSHLSRLTGVDIYLKKEFLQHTGSFKERGACNALLALSCEERRNGVVAASAGNHAQALSYHGFLLGIPVTVVMPIIAPIMKIQNCKKYNAKVIVQGKDMGEAKKIALKLAQTKGLTFINAFDNLRVIAGQGTMALEILEQVPDVDGIVVPTGGGGMISGIAVAAKAKNPDIKIIGVESEKCPGYSTAMAQGGPTLVAVEGTLADGLAVPVIGYHAWETSKGLIDKMVVVNERWVALAILRFVENEKCIVEGAGACGLAAILSGQLNEFKGKRLVLVLSGGNIDTTVLGRCLERGLAVDGRLVKCRVTVKDRPGGVGEFCELVGSIGISIKHIVHERAWLSDDIYSVDVVAICETRGYDHSIELQNLLQAKFKKVEFEQFPTRQSIAVLEAPK